MLPPHKPLPPILLLGLAVLALVTSGCTFQQKSSIRLKSFEPYENHHIGLTETITDVRTFLSSRTALLISGDSLPHPKWKEGVLRISNIHAMGCAAAIDHRGYLLTAAHCVEDKPVYLVFTEPGKPVRAQRARVVWRGNLQNKEPDLALLHIPRTLDYVFDWADDPGKSEPVMAVGIFRTENKIHGPQYMGGKILKSDHRKGDRNGFMVVHDLPLQSGDSGGPLVNAAARLIGINILSTHPLMRFLLPGSQFPKGVAERPDRKWLANIIEEDALAPQPPASHEVFVFGPGKPPPQ